MSGHKLSDDIRAFAEECPQSLSGGNATSWAYRAAALEGEIRRLGQLARPLSEEWPKTTRDAARYRALRVAGILMLAAEYTSAPYDADGLDALADDLRGRAAETEGSAR